MTLQANDRGGGLVTNDRGNGAIEVRDGGTALGGTLCFDFTGAGVSVALDASGCAVVTIPGGGGGGATRQTVYDAQAAVPVTQTTAATLNTGAFSWELLRVAGAPFLSANGTTRVLTFGNGDPGTGKVGAVCPQTLEVNTEFGDGFRLGYDQPVSGKAGLYALNADTFNLRHTIQGQPVDITTTGVDGTGPAASGTIKNRSGDASGTATTAGNVENETGTVPDGGTTGQVRHVVNGATAGAIGTAGYVLSRLQGSGWTEDHAVHRFERVADAAYVFVGTIDPDGAIDAPTSSVHHRDTGTTGRVAVNTSAGGSGTDWRTLLQDGDAASVLVFGNGSTSAGTTDRYLTQGWDSGGAPLAAGRVDSLSPRAGSIRRLTVKHGSAGGGATMTYTVQVNGVDTGVSVTMLASDTSVQIDASNVAAVAAGDEIGIKVSKSAAMGAGPGTIRASLEIVPTL